jgi:hypothetical protein
MGKSNSHPLLELLGKYMHPKSEAEDLPKYTIEEFIPDIHNCVGTPQISLRNH